mgnify:CR=1 FL=1
MDFGQLFNTLLNSLPNQVWYFVPLFILLPILRTPWFKGKAGEAMVNLAAKLFLDKTHYHLLKTSPCPPKTVPPRSITSLCPATACSWWKRRT